MAPPLDHLLVAGFTTSQPFRSTLTARNTPPPQRDRRRHGEALLAQLAALHAQMGQRQARQTALALPVHGGMTVALEISPPGAIDYFKQLEWHREGIEILCAVEAGGAEIVSLFVPEGGLAGFERRIRDYLTKDVKSKKEGQPDKPASAALVNAIAAFRLAAFDELWTDSVDPPPAEVRSWFQVWLRISNDTPGGTRQAFVDAAVKVDLEVEPGYIVFPGRVVVAVYGLRRALEEALELLDLIAEIRSVAPSAEFFLSDLKPYEQGDWVGDLHARTTFPAAGDGSYITLLDTGVNSGHVLLAGGLHPNDLHAVRAEWHTADHHGHGTGMAGLTLHGDLTTLLAGADLNVLSHRLESVKILPPAGANAAHLYGWVTAQAASIVEERAPERNRTLAMMTTSQGKTAGFPSEWSAQIDRLSFGLNDLDDSVPNANRKPRLYVLAAGNVHWEDWGNYPVVNDTSTIENPGQAWNALTVGAYTQLHEIDAAKWPSFVALAQPGGMSPASTTSLIWQSAWPLKPDVVAEGGNGSRDTSRANEAVVGPESLRLLTTYYRTTVSPLTESGDTSGAAAEVARICGRLQAHYPTYWPETNRALVVHGARLTSKMREALPLVPNARDKSNLLRRFGYGVVDYERSAVSARSEPTLVLQEEITPYLQDGAQVKLGNMNLHDLPWPAAQLRALGEQPVALRVTLSYFIEPNPAARGWQSKFRYQSHGLRFAVKASTESDDRFQLRINKLIREEQGSTESIPDPDVSGWFLGPQLRSRGSIHSDAWFGNASQLASKSHIAVFPVGGWWKDWKGRGRQDLSVRYALVVTLEVLEGADVDLYTPIANEIGIAVPIV